nr:MAG TPA: hypothetical protein [Caudoviricetes sp.]
MIINTHPIVLLPTGPLQMSRSTTFKICGCRSEARFTPRMLVSFVK